jgi:peptidoglycan hydrolase-like protein with peptidoglycan-binding domain
MTIKKTIGAIAVTSGLASGTLLVGLTLPASAAVAAPAAATVRSAAAVTTTRSAPDALKAWPVLREGANSAWPKVTVRSLQYLLNAHGYKVPATGVFAAITRADVIAFQRAHRLAADGVVGPQTWAALISTVRLGSNGYAVRAVQDQGNYRAAKYHYTVAVDGIFGPVTELFVRAFQVSAGLTPDGVVGALTWQALITEAP